MAALSNQPVDIVITWMDNNDSTWQDSKNSFIAADKNSAENSSAIDIGSSRYRDWDTLRICLRNIEHFAPWVRKVFLITCGHLPVWLDTSNPKLVIVKHSDFIPAEYLPTFNSNAIEMNFHRIEGLSEHFIYFNDDMLLTKPANMSDFFKNGMPVDMLALQPIVANRDNPNMSYMFLNNSMLLSRHFVKYDNIKMQPAKYFHIGYPVKYFVYNMLEMAFPRFTGFYTVHGPSPLLKSTLKTLWEIEYDALDTTCRNRFRANTDTTIYCVREWQKLSGSFVARNVHSCCGYFELSDDNSRLYAALKKRRYSNICINDSNRPLDYEKIKKELTEALLSSFPVKSSFEL